MKQPIKRSSLRSKLGMLYYGTFRKIMWIKKSKFFASSFSKTPLSYSYFTHKTILMRQLKDVDMWLQKNKIVNLKIACKAMNGITIKPGEVFSYWKVIGKPSSQKGYLKGMVLKNGTFEAGTGGGLCQLSNLIFWMTIHTPLTIVERHRHGYDVFPDANRTQPFGSGATCFYPHGDLMIQNNTQDTYQLVLGVGDEYLEGEWRVSAKPIYRYEIVERNHEMKGEYWGGYSRHNDIFQIKYNGDNQVVDESLVVQNEAIMMYCPFLNSGDTDT